MRYVLCVMALSLAACADQGGADTSVGDESKVLDQSSGSGDTVVIPVTPRGDFMGAPVIDLNQKSLGSRFDLDDDAPSAEAVARPEGAEVAR